MLTLDRLTKKYGEFTALDGLSRLVKRMVQKREIRSLQEQLRESAEQKRQNELMLNELNNDSLVIDRIARERYNMHSEDEDLFLESK